MAVDSVYAKGPRIDFCSFMALASREIELGDCGRDLLVDMHISLDILLSDLISNPPMIPEFI